MNNVKYDFQRGNQDSRAKKIIRIKNIIDDLITEKNNYINNYNHISNTTKSVDETNEKLRKAIISRIELFEKLNDKSKSIREKLKNSIINFHSAKVRFNKYQIQFNNKKSGVSHENLKKEVKKVLYDIFNMKKYYNNAKKKEESLDNFSKEIDKLKDVHDNLSVRNEKLKNELRNIMSQIAEQSKDKSEITRKIYQVINKGAENASNLRKQLEYWSGYKDVDYTEITPLIKNTLKECNAINVQLDQLFLDPHSYRHNAATSAKDNNVLSTLSDLYKNDLGTYNDSDLEHFGVGSSELGSPRSNQDSPRANNDKAKGSLSNTTINVSDLEATPINKENKSKYNKKKAKNSSENNTYCSNADIFRPFTARTSIKVLPAMFNSCSSSAELSDALSETRQRTNFMKNKHDVPSDLPSDFYKNETGESEDEKGISLTKISSKKSALGVSLKSTFMTISKNVCLTLPGIDNGILKDANVIKMDKSKIKQSSKVNDQSKDFNLEEKNSLVKASYVDSESNEEGTQQIAKKRKLKGSDSSKNTAPRSNANTSKCSNESDSEPSQNFIDAETNAQAQSIASLSHNLPTIPINKIDSDIDHTTFKTPNETKDLDAKTFDSSGIEIQNNDSSIEKGDTSEKNIQKKTFITRDKSLGQTSSGVVTNSPEKSKNMVVNSEPPDDGKLDEKLFHKTSKSLPSQPKSEGVGDGVNKSPQSKHKSLELSTKEHVTNSHGPFSGKSLENTTKKRRRYMSKSHKNGNEDERVGSLPKPSKRKCSRKRKNNDNNNSSIHSDSREVNDLNLDNTNSKKFESHRKGKKQVETLEKDVKEHVNKCEPFGLYGTDDQNKQTSTDLNAHSHKPEDSDYEYYYTAESDSEYTHEYYDPNALEYSDNYYSDDEPISHRGAIQCIRRPMPGSPFDNIKIRRRKRLAIENHDSDVDIEVKPVIGSLQSTKYWKPMPDDFDGEIYRCSANTAWTRLVLKDAIYTQLGKTKLHIDLADISFHLIRLDEKIDLAKMKLKEAGYKWVNLGLYINTSSVTLSPGGPKAAPKREKENQTELSGAHIDSINNRVKDNISYLSQTFINEQHKIVCQFHIPHLEETIYRLINRNQSLRLTIEDLERNLLLVRPKDGGISRTSAIYHDRISYEQAIHQRNQVLHKIESDTLNAQNKIKSLKTKIKDQKCTHDMIKRKIVQARSVPQPSVKFLCRQLDSQRVTIKNYMEKMVYMQIENKYLSETLNKSTKQITELTSDLENGIKVLLSRLSKKKQTFDLTRRTDKSKRSVVVTCAGEIQIMEDRVKECQNSLVNIKQRELVLRNKIAKNIQTLNEFRIGVPYSALVNPF